MLFVLILSVSASFAVTDDDTLAIDDETAVEEDSLSIEEDSEPLEDASEGEALEADDSGDDVLKEDNVVTPENWENFIDENRMITYDGDELIFEGNFTADLGIGNIQIVMPITLTGTNAVMTNVSFYVLSDEVVIDGFTLIEDRNDISPIFVMDAEDVEISNVKMNFTAIDGYIGGYAIWINDAVNIRLLNNEINYVGTTVYNVSGTDKRFAVLIEDSSKVLLQGNKFDIQTTSCAVDWVEEPAGSWNYVRYPNVSGIRITDTDEVTFENNEVNIKFIDVSGSADTIYVLDLDGCDDAIITNNTINSLGYGYIYNIIITGDDFEISSNNITATGNNYACGIDIEGPASGVVENNTIVCNANSSAYAIYSGMNYKEVRANYTGNNISGKAYCFFGFSIGDVESNIKGNQLFMDGNYTTGIAYKGSKVNIEENRIVLLASEEGNEYIWDSFGVEAVGIKVVQGEALIKNNTIATSGKGISLTRSLTSASVEDNFINVVGNDDKDAYAIYASDVAGLNVFGNYIDYQGTTKGTGINNAVYLKNTTEAVISENKFEIELVSINVPWAEVPSGSGNWVPSPVSEGIVFEDSDGVVFESNNVTVNYGEVLSGGYDSIYGIDLKNSSYAAIAYNNIETTGNTYVYGITTSSDNYLIIGNNITTIANYYAEGIEVKSSGIIADNVISSIAPDIAYGIGPGMASDKFNVEVSENDISGNAYYACGINFANGNISVEDNNIILNGNYTVGINSGADNLNAEGNVIIANASNEGSTSYSGIVTETLGISVNSGVATICENTIESTSNTAVDLGDTPSTVEDNKVIANGTSGNDAISASGNATIKGNGVLITKLSGIDLSGVYGDVLVYKLSLTYENGTAIANQHILISVGENNITIITDGNGYATMKIDTASLNLGKGDNIIKASYAGDGSDVGSTTTNIISITPKATKLDYKKSVTVLITAVKKGSAYYKITLKDADGKAIAGKQIKVVFNGATKTVTTDKNGVANFKLSAKKVGNYKITMNFAGDDKYAASTATATIKVSKEATKLTAKKKTFKAKVKTKKYTVTVKDSKGKAIKGLKLTLKVKGKTIKATTNAKGKATFKIKNLKKKGKFTAKVKFAGNNLYKSAVKSVKITVKK